LNEYIVPTGTAASRFAALALGLIAGTPASVRAWMTSSADTDLAGTDAGLGPGTELDNDVPIQRAIGLEHPGSFGAGLEVRTYPVLGEAGGESAAGRG
jgi:hypothetical protein